MTAHLFRALLFLALFACSSFAQTVSITGTDGLSHSVVRVSFNVSAAYASMRTRYAASPATCTGGTGGSVQQWSGGIKPLSGMRVVVGGLAPNTTYQICPEVTADGTHWSSGAGVTVTTLPLPAVHPAPPIPPVTFNTSMPNVSGYSTVTVASDCHDFQADLNAAVGNQLTNGTIISIPAGTVCSSGATYSIGANSPDTYVFGAAQVNTSNSTISWSSHGLSEGATVVFSTNYSTLPASTSCMDGTGFAEQGFVSGQLYPVHVVDANTIQVYCDKPPAQGGTQMTFTNTGSGSAMYVRPEPDPNLNWVIVRTATPDAQFIPEHSRVTPVWLPKMASFVQPMSLYSNSTPNNELLVIGNPDGNAGLLVSNIRFVGIEFTVADDSVDTLTSTDPQFWWRQIYTWPWDQNIILDRIYVHGRGRPSRLFQGMLWDGHNMGIVDSYFDNLTYFHSAYTGLTLANPSGTQITIAPGQHHMGAIDPVLRTTATVNISGTVNVSGTSVGISYIYFDMGGNLKVTMPPGISATCSGAPCTVVNTNATTGNGVRLEPSSGGAFPSTSANGISYYIDPIFSASSTGGTEQTLFATDPGTLGASWTTVGGSEFGTVFYSDTSGYIQGCRFFKNASDTGTHSCSLWTTSGTLLATAAFSNETSSGWQTQLFATAVPVTSGTNYIVSSYSSTGAVWYTVGLFTNGVFDNAPLHAVRNYDPNNASCNTSSAFPKNALGHTAAGEIGCVAITGSAVSSFTNADANSSLFNAEGSSYMIGGLGPGPYVDRNNYREGAGLTWHHDDGGGDVRLRCDYTYDRDYWLFETSHMYQTPNSDGYYYAHRHMLEWKSGCRIAITGSIFDGATQENTPIGDFFEAGSYNGAGTHDFLLQNTTFMHGPAGFFAPASYANNSDPEGPPPVRVTMKNNLFWDISGVYHSLCCFGDGSGKGWIMTNGGGGEEDTVFDHNTVIANTGVSPDLWYVADSLHEGVQFTNNFVYLSVGDWGFGADPSTPCTSYLGKATADCLFGPNGNSYRFDHNVLMSNGTQSQVRSAWPSTLLNYIPSDPTNYANTGFFNYDNNPTQFVNGNPKHYNFKLNANYRSSDSSHASDGLDVGANIDALESAQGKVTLIGASSVTSTSAIVAFVAPDASGCAVDYSSKDPKLINSFTRVPDTGGAVNRSIALSGLTSGSLYYYRVDCAVQQPTGQFSTP
ncbi:MAG: DUF4082 domain-containing protein [Bryobacteraceae bacterium]